MYSALICYSDLECQERCLKIKCIVIRFIHSTKVLSSNHMVFTSFFLSTKVFLKEKERLLLQDILNKEAMRRIIILQRWFRTSLIRLHFLQKRDATLLIQVYSLI